MAIEEPPNRTRRKPLTVLPLQMGVQLHRVGETMYSLDEIVDKPSVASAHNCATTDFFTILSLVACVDAQNHLRLPFQ